MQLSYAAAAFQFADYRYIELAGKPINDAVQAKLIFDETTYLRENCINIAAHKERKDEVERLEAKLIQLQVDTMTVIRKADKLKEETSFIGDGGVA